MYVNFLYILYVVPFYISISSYIIIQYTFMCSNKTTVLYVFSDWQAE